MSLENLEFSKLKSLNNEFKISFDNLQKNELTSFTNQVLEDVLHNKGNIISIFDGTIKEYLSRNKIQNEISFLCQRETSLSRKLTEFQRKLQLKTEDKISKDTKREIQERIISLYENNLGLTIDIADNLSIGEREYAISLVFHNINENRPEDKYSLVLATDGIVYKIYTCCPSVDEINELLLALNSTNDLHSFAVNLRTKFLQSIKK